MRRLILLFLVVGGMLVTQAPALACSCVDASRREHFEAADVVFSGIATASEQVGQPPPPGAGAPDRPVRWTFSVDGEQKGQVSDPERVTTEGSGAACGYRFRSGNRYQVYAYRDDGDLWTGLCTGTHQLGANEEPYQPRQQPSPSPSGSPTPSGSLSPSGSPSPSVAPTGSTGSPSPTESALPQTGSGTARLRGFAALLLFGALALGARGRRRRLS